VLGEGIFEGCGANENSKRSATQTRISEMDGFETCVAQAQTYLYDTMVDLEPTLREQLRAPVVAEEAAPLDACVRAFVDAEMNGITVGRAGPVKFFPAIGDYAGKALAKLGPDADPQVRHLIGVTIGIGYVLIGSAQSNRTELPRRELAVLWPPWVSSISGDLVEQYGLPEDIVEFFRQVGARAFRGWIGQASRGRIKGRGKAERSGGYYTQAGMTLRVCQEYTGDFPDDPLAQLWPYEDFVSSA
jgi:hypothetical protein